MSLTVGRVGLDVTLNNPAEMSLSGDVLRMSGPFRVSSVANMKALRQQLAGYVDNPWEKWVPVTFSTDSSIDGYYQVLDATVDVPTFGYRNGFATFDLTLLRSPGYSAGWQEMILMGADRDTATGGITPSTWHAIPGALRGSYDTPGASLTAVARAGPGGSVQVFTHASYYYDARTLMYRTPANWYDMAATIKVGSVVQVGRQVVSDTSSWELSNGLIRITPGTSTSFLNIQGANGGSYGTAVAIDVGAFNGSWFPTTISGTVTVTRNCPEECGLRIATPVVGGSQVVDLNLRRGSQFVNVTISSTVSAKWGLATSAVTAMTAITGGMNRTSNDGNGNRVVICSAKPYTTDLTNGYLYLTSNGTFHDAMVGMEITGTSASAPDRETDLRDQFFAAITETQSVVAR